MTRAKGAAFLCTSLASACAAAPEETPRPRRAPGKEIVVCGERYPIGAPVVLWFDGGGYNAYRTEPQFGDEGPVGMRYEPGRASDLEELQDVVDLFVLHYDACGTSERCFRVLQDLRGLSVHFLLDVDGTIYQTLDLQEKAWHARQANPRSIGIEIANIGAYPAGEPSPLDEWYAPDEAGVRLTIPSELRRGVRTAGFVGRPARPEPVVGERQGRVLQQYDFTPEQYASLEKLTAALCRIFPHIEADAPRDDAGDVRTNALSDAEFRTYTGILGHEHVSRDKVDPGPAFDWERFLSALRGRLRLHP